MAAEENTPESSAPAPIAEIEHGPSKFEQFLDRNHKKLIIGASVLVLAISGTYLYSEIKKGAEEDAGGALVKALQAPNAAESALQLEQVITQEAGKRAATTAEIFLAQAKWDAGDQEAALETLAQFIQKHPQHPALGSALLKQANYQLALGEEEAAIASFESILNTPQAQFAAPQALLVLGDLAAKSGDSEKARGYYERFAKDFPAANFSGNGVNLIQDRIDLLEFTPPTPYTPAPEAETPEAATPAPVLPAADETAEESTEASE